MRIPMLRSARAALSAGGLILASASPLPASAQSTTTRLQDATVVAKGNTISISRLPIQTPSGTIYRDVTIELHVDATGRVTLATNGAGRSTSGGASPGGTRQVALRAVPSGTPQADDAIELPQRPSPPVVFQHFTPGTYSASDGSLLRLSERGTDLVHNVPMWTLSSDGGVITSATFYSGPPRLNPRSRRLRNAGLTSETFAYGTSDGGAGEVFGTGALIGVAQNGKTLRVVSFHHGCCSDGDEPTGSVSYTYVGR